MLNFTGLSFIVDVESNIMEGKSLAIIKEI